MNQTLRNFTRYLDEDGVTYELIRLRDNEDAILIRQRLKKNSSALISLFVHCTDKPTEVHIRIYGLGKLNNFTIDALQLINSLNRAYSSYTFYADNDSEIVMSTDFFIEDIGSNRPILAALYRGCSIADDCYPPIMRLLWG